MIRGTQATLLMYAGSAPSASTMSALRAIEARVSELAEHLRTRYVFATEIDARNAGMTDTDALLDGTEHMRRAFGLQQAEIVYIRPDGYIGLRTQDLDARRLMAYLARVYVSNTKPIRG